MPDIEEMEGRKPYQGPVCPQCKGNYNLHLYDGSGNSVQGQKLKCGWCDWVGYSSELVWR